jgi:hypothetical protein
VLPLAAVRQMLQYDFSMSIGSSGKSRPHSSTGGFHVSYGQT